MACSFNVRLKRSATPLVCGFGHASETLVDPAERDLLEEIGGGVWGAMIHA